MRFSSRRVVTPRIIHEERVVWPYWLILLLLVSAVAAWYAYDYGRKVAGLDLDHYEKQEDSLRQEVAGLKFRVEALRLDATSCQRDTQIDRVAVEQARQDLAKLQGEKAELQREVELLNGLLSSKSITATLQMEKLAITRLDKDGQYRVTFTLVHKTKVGGKVTGRADLSVNGRKNEEALTLALADISSETENSTRLGFKNFQKLELMITLPEGFVPESITINTTTDNKNLEAFEETVTWKVD